MQVQHILVKALSERPPKSIMRVKRWLEKLFEGTKLLRAEVFQLSETAFSAVAVAAQTHCTMHISGDCIQMDFYAPKTLDADHIISKLQDFQITDHEVLLVDRSGEFHILVSCVKELGKTDPNGDY
jgi:hypothetical protein